MDTRSTTTVLHNPFAEQFTGSFNNSDSVNRRLEILLGANADIRREKTMYRSDRERQEAAMMRAPIASEKVFAYFGLLLGIFPPLVILAKMAANMGPSKHGNGWVAMIFFIVNILSAITGYHSGKVVGNVVRNFESRSWTFMLHMAPLAGIAWGIIAGGAGGVIVFGIGAFFGAVLGAAVGAVALPVFVIFHRLLKRGDLIDRRHFLPLAFGITFTICSFILGL